MTPGAQIIVAVVFAAAVVGYFVGLTRPGGRPAESVQSGAEPAPSTAPTGDAVPATAYRDMDARRFGPNRDWRTHLAALVQPDEQDPFEFAALRTIDPIVREDAKRLALAERATRRAYNGAPPVVPHPIDQTSSTACIACHGPGLVVEDRRAGRLPHALFANCAQCHVEQLGSAPTGSGGRQVAALLIANRFTGLAAPLGGERAWIGAPPTIPHSTLMRQECLACHGVGGAFGMQSTHPWRTGCLQCHASSSVLDQVPVDAWSAAESPERSPDHRAERGR